MSSPINRNPAHQPNQNPKYQNNQPKKETLLFKATIRNTSLQSNPRIKASLSPFSSTFKPGAGLVRTTKDDEAKDALLKDDYKELISSYSDGPSGILFSHFLNVLKRRIDKIYQTIDLSTQDDIRSAVKQLLQIEVKKHYPHHSGLFIFAIFQVCLLIEIEEDRDALFLQFMEDYPIEPVNLIESVLYKIGLNRKNPFSIISGFFTLIAECYLTLEKKPISITIQEKSRLEDKKSLKIITYLIHTKSDTLTLEIPYNLQEANTLLEDANHSIHLSSFLNPFFSSILFPQKNIFVNNEETFFYINLNMFVKKLFNSESIEFMHLAIQLMLVVDSKIVVSLKEFEDPILKNLPSIVFYQLKENAHKTILKAIKILFPNLLKNSDLLTLSYTKQNICPFDDKMCILKGASFIEEKDEVNFIKQYIRSLLKEQEFKKVEIALTILKKELFSSVLLDMQSYLSFTHEVMKTIFATRDPEIIEIGYLFLNEVAKNYHHNFSCHFKSHLNYLLDQNQTEKAYMELNRLLSNYSLNFDDSDVHKIALEICNLSNKEDVVFRCSFFYSSQIFGRMNTLASELPVLNAVANSKTFLKKDFLNLILPHLKKTALYYLQEQQLTQALELINNHFKSFSADPHFLIDFINRILKFKEFPKDACHEIFSSLLNLKNTTDDLESKKIILLLNFEEKLSPFSDHLKMAIAKNQDQWLSFSDETFFLQALKLLFKIFEPKDLFQRGFKKCNQKWVKTLEFLKVETRDPQILRLKEFILKSLFLPSPSKDKSKICVKEQLLKLFNEWLDLNDQEASIHLLNYFHANENNLQFFSSDAFISSFVRCLQAIKKQEFPEKTLLQLLTKVSHHESFHHNPLFQNTFREIGILFLKSAHYREFLFLHHQFNFFMPPTDVECEEALTGLLLDKNFEKSAELFFETLVKTKQDVLIWNIYFEKTKKNQIPITQFVTKALLNDATFLANLLLKSSASSPKEVCICVLHFLESIKENPKAALQYLLIVNPIFLIEKNFPLEEKSIPLVFSIFEKVFKILEKNSTIKIDLIFKLFKTLAKVQLKRRKDTLNFYKLFIKACQGETNDIMIDVKTILLHKFIVDSDLEHESELVCLIREFFKEWPKERNLTINNRCFADATEEEIAISNHIRFQLIPDLINKTFLLKTEKLETYFDEFENLIQNQHPEIQKLALKFYSHSLLQIQKKQILQTARSSNRTQPNALLMLSFNNPSVKVLINALYLFLHPLYLSSLTQKQTAEYTEKIIKQLMIYPPELFSDSHINNSIYLLFIAYIGSRPKQKIKTTYIRYFIHLNNQLFDSNINRFIQQQNDLFGLISRLEKLGNIQIAPPSIIPPHLLLLQNNAKLFQEKPSKQLLLTICSQLTNFYDTVKNNKNLALFHNHFLIIHEIFNNELFCNTLLKKDLKTASINYINYLKISACFITSFGQPFKGRAKMISICQQILKVDKAINYSEIAAKDASLIYSYVKNTFYFSQFLELFDPEFEINISLFEFFIKNREKINLIQKQELSDLFSNHYRRLEEFGNHLKKLSPEIKLKLHQLLKIIL